MCEFMNIQILHFVICFRQEYRYLNSTNAFKAGFPERYYKMVAQEHIFGSHMKPRQSLP